REATKHGNDYQCWQRDRGPQGGYNAGPPVFCPRRLPRRGGALRQNREGLASHGIWGASRSGCGIEPNGQRGLRPIAWPGSAVPSGRGGRPGCFQKPIRRSGAFYDLRATVPLPFERHSLYLSRGFLQLLDIDRRHVAFAAVVTVQPNGEVI